MRVKTLMKYWLLRLPVVGNYVRNVLGKRLAMQEQRISSKGTNADIFSTIYRNQLWKEGDDTVKGFYSGTGSRDENARRYVVFLNQFIKENGIKSMTDIGCGDFFLGKQICDDNRELKYNGVDVVSEMISSHKAKFGNERVQFFARDASQEDIPASELLTIRQVLQHLSNKDVSNILKKINSFKYVLITEHLPKNNLISSYNIDKPSGGDTRVGLGSGVFIDKPPFSLPAKEVLRCEVNEYGDIVTFQVTHPGS